MQRYLAAPLAAMFVLGAALSSGLATPARADGPFETVPLPQAVSRPHHAATACFLAGAGLIAGSFSLARHADRAYERYLTAQTPGDITRWYDESTRYDRWSSAALFGGEAAVATGLYLRFLRRPPPPIALIVAPGACAVSFRF